MGECSLSGHDVNFLQEIKKLKKSNAESKQVKVLELRQQRAYSKTVRENHESVRMPDSVCHVVGSGSRYWQWVGRRRDLTGHMIHQSQYD